MRNLKLYALIVVCFSAPAVTQAYFTTNQQALAVTDTTGFFTITYEFGFDTRDAYLPIAATRGDSDHEKVLIYDIMADEEDVVEDGTAAGMVLSTAEIRDGRYYIPAGETASFTLFVVYTAPEGETEEDYSVQVTHLPFDMHFLDTGYVNENGLNEPELRPYITPEIELNIGVYPERDESGAVIRGEEHELRTAEYHI